MDQQLVYLLNITENRIRPKYSALRNTFVYRQKGVVSPLAITLLYLLVKKNNDPINNVGIDGQFLKLVSVHMTYHTDC